MTDDPDADGATRRLAEFAVGLEADAIDEAVRRRATAAMADNLGVAIAGATAPAGDLILDHVETALAGDEATIVTGRTASAVGAALANGTLAGALSYDDTFESMVIHPSSGVLPAVLAATELVDGSGADLLRGYVAGVETSYRIGRATHPAHYEAGWHSTGTIGTFGAAAGAGAVLGLGVDEVRTALGIAGSTAAGLRKNGGTMTFALHGGRAAAGGLEAAQLARSGFTADPAVFDGALNYGALTADGAYDPTAIDGALEGVPDIGLKAYPCARIPQAAMDGLREILTAHDLSARAVDRVVAEFDPSLAGILDRPDPADVAEARGSIEFCLGVVLADGDAGMRSFTADALSRPAVRSAMATVEPRYTAELGEAFSTFGACVRVHTADGDTHEAEVHDAPGSPANPLGEARRREKFRDCTRSALSADDADDLFAALQTIETAPSVAAVVDRLGSHRDRPDDRP